MAALTALHQAESSQKHVTGLLYFDNTKPALAEDLGLVETPLIDVPAERLRPSKSILDELNAALLG
jgi:2-oxoglutarate ferredoxin oxidoreductase subunit beta